MNPACMNSSTLPSWSAQATWRRTAPRFDDSRTSCWTSRKRMSPAVEEPIPSSSTIVHVAERVALEADQAGERPSSS
jgi:hypothetical protein